MSRQGNPYDNAKAESFFKTLKYEEVDLWEYEDLAPARQRIGSFVEDVYNRRRLHPAFGYRPPVEFEPSCKRNPVLNSWSQVRGSFPLLYYRLVTKEFKKTQLGIMAYKITP